MEYLFGDVIDVTFELRCFSNGLETLDSLKRRQQKVPRRKRWP